MTLKEKLLNEDEFPLIQGGGNMGAMMREKRWADTKMGSPAGWPLQLKQLIATMLVIPSPMLICWGHEYIQFYNDAFRPILGANKHPQALGIGADETYAEIWVTIKPMFEGVMQGKPVFFDDFRLMMDRNGYLEEVFFDFSYSPIMNDVGEIQGILVICTETTEKVKSIRQLAQSEQRFQNLVREATVGIVVFIGKESRVSIVNTAYARLVGRSCEDLIGKNIFELIPETEAQFRPIIESVRTSGEPLNFYSTPYAVKAGDETIEGYLNLIYQPYREQDGSISGVMVLCQDVTEQVKAQQNLKETEVKLRIAIELAELGTWEFDQATGEVTLSAKSAGWLGLDQVVPVERFLAVIEAPDRQRVKAELFNTIQMGADAKYAAEYTATNARTGRKIVIHERGQATPGGPGKPLRIIATTQDVTLQRRSQLALEKQVQLRTEELAAAISELRSTNDDLAEMNKRIMQSNSELAQFAYIASHDLQEPLRKISTFTTMLENYGRSMLDEKSLGYIEKIKRSALRMNVLIRDVLAYSELAKKNDALEQVDLSRIVEEVIQDYDLTIEQKGAKLQVGSLPVVDAIPLQMTQLFANLIGNALKFTKKDVVPVIEITSAPLSMLEMKANPLLNPSLDYTKITVRDNGIGFNDEHADHIFHIFQRLHRKSDFEGTGIGLALCKKIALNHHGDINAEGSSEEGAVFNVILQVKSAPR